MSSADHLDIGTVHPFLPPCTWFGTWAPAQVYSLQPAASEPAVATPRDSGPSRESSHGLVRVNFFGSGAASSEFATAA